jgi:transcriptional regulator with XRE-family HTH domain
VIKAVKLLRHLERKMDFGNGTIRRWDTTTPSGDKLLKVADYFNVSVDYLLGRDKKESPTLDESEREISDDDIMFALWGDSSEIDDEDLEDVKRYAEFVKQRKKGKQ